MSSFRRENGYILNQATDTLARYDNMRREDEEREKREQEQANNPFEILDIFVFMI